MDDQAYAVRERYQYVMERQRREHAPLVDRWAARQDYVVLLQSPDLLADRVAWVLEGQYGYGARMAAQDILRRPRMNRVAALGMLVADVECQCPGRFAVQAWKAITVAQQGAVVAAVTQAITEYTQQEV